MNRSLYMFDYLWFITSKYDEWALVGAWAAIRLNTVYVYPR